nr:sigma 54-interacting transcriptional regulator [Desulfosporosinus orientis]
MDILSYMTSRSGTDTVESLITLDYPKVTEDWLISEVYEEFGQLIEYLYVVNADGLLVGLLDQATIKIQAEVHKAIQKPVRDLICKVSICLASNRSTKEAISLFIKQKVTEIPVTDEAGRMIGVLKLWSLLNYHERKLEQLDQELDNSKRLTATLEAVIKNPYEGIVVVDESSHVIMINNFYLEVLGLTKEQALGKHIIDLTPHSKLPDIIRTGVAQFAEHWKVRDRDFLIIRAPIKRGSKTIGAFGKTLFKDMGLAHTFARKLAQLEEDLKFYKEELSKIHKADYTFNDIIGKGPKISSTVSLARRAARTASTVLLTGESGTGKELFAHAIHNDSVRRHGPFIKVDCVAIPEQLFESELFGYAEGAFTGV